MEDYLYTDALEEILADLVDTPDSELTEDELEEREELLAAKEEIPEWDDNQELILDGNWEEYAMQLLEDSGDIPSDLPWYVVIDREATADNVQDDYSSVELFGNIYWYRCS